MTRDDRRAAKRPFRPAAAVAAGLLILGGIRTAAAQVVGEFLGENAARFFESEAAARAVPPSWALGGRKYTPGRAVALSVAPTFAADDGEHIVKVPVAEGTSLYGLGRTPGPLLRNGMARRAVDVPWVMAVRKDGSGFGILADTAWPCEADLHDGITLRTRGPAIPVIILEAATPAELLVQFTNLTGRIEIPPRWSLGYLHGAASIEDAGPAAHWLHDRGFPCDALILGDPATPTPFQPAAGDAAARALADDLHAAGLHLIGSVSPWIPAEVENEIFADGAAGEHLLHAMDGTTFRMSRRGTGDLTAPDLTRTEPRRWWSRLTSAAAAAGADGFLVGIGRPLEAARFDGDPELGGRGGWDRYQRIYPALLARAVWEGAGGERVNRRPVVLSGFAGAPVQKWTAGIVPTSGAESAVAAAIDLALTGQPLVAGAFGTEPDPAALARAAGLAAMMPMAIGGGDWAKGDPSTAATTIKRAMERRARLVPYLYTLCFNAAIEGQPILRPVFFAEPANASLRAVDGAFLLGPDLLVVPRPADGGHSPSPLKAWARIDLEDGDDLPDLYLRPGAVLPLGPVVRHAGESSVDPLTLMVALDDSGKAVGGLYEDRGDGFELYKTELRRVRYQAQRQDGSVYLRLAGLDGRLPLPRRVVKVRVLTGRGDATGEGSERGTIKIDVPGGE